MTSAVETTASSAIAATVNGLRALDDDAVLVGPPFMHLVDSAGDGPLSGLAIAVKDNIDVAGVPTTAACPSRSHVPSVNADCIDRLLAAGAVPVAKTNMDQFATGLVGTRSPLGVPRNPFNATLVPGGSSSGSAVAVASGAVPIALGTDTAGSGRVPAALCGIVGFKPTCGWISTRGVLPAMWRFDCVSVFAENVTDAYRVVEAAAGFDPLDPASRHAPVVTARRVRVIGVPEVLPPGVCDAETERVMAELPRWLTTLGFEVVQVPIERLLAWGQLLYGSALVAERELAFGHLIDGAPDANDVVRAIVDRSSSFTAVDAYEVERELAIGRRHAEQLFTDIDALVLPTTPGVATLDEVAADPIGKNAWLGTFTTFVNPLDLAAVAIPHQQ
ncbi:MAG: amidase family protein, partial [Acidimicrobiia bacterium]